MTKIGTRDHHVLLALLRDIRTRAGIRQIDVAERMNVPQSMVSKYELGERRLDVLELRDVCAALDVPLIDFIRELETRLDHDDEAE